ncbi:hypothetical protein EIP86_003553 [Pleurotus ostreatoroseus]|nr:hypothetical protein EIP86_003553 [Pleurotus ostreatoroseus]
MSTLRPRKSNEFVWCMGFLDIVWPDLCGRPKDFERIQDIIIESKYSASSKQLQELCGILQDYPDHIKQYAVSLVDPPRQLTLPDDYSQTAVFDYTNLQGETRKLASFGLSSDESSSRDHKILRLIMNALVNPQMYEPALLELVGSDALRTLKVMNDLITNGKGSWVRFAEGCKFLHQYTPGTSDMWRVRRLKCRLHVRTNELPRSLVKTVTGAADQREAVSGSFILCKGQLSNALGLTTQVYIQKPGLRTKSGTNPGHAERVKRIFLQQCIIWSDLRHKNLVSLLGINSTAALIKQSVITQSLNMRDRISDLRHWRKKIAVSKWVSA